MIAVMSSSSKQAGEKKLALCIVNIFTTILYKYFTRYIYNMQALIINFVMDK